MADTKLTVISHKNCTDGMMAAFWQYLWISANDELESTQFLFCQYNQPIPEIKAQVVLVLDFSFTPEELNTDKFKDKHISIHDHHKSSAEMFGGYGHSRRPCCNGTSTVYAHFAEDLSGAELSYRHLFGKRAHSKEVANALGLTVPIVDRLRKVSLCVQDRDLWKFKLPDTRAVYELLNSVPPTFEAWKQLLINTPEEEFNAALRNMQVRVDMRTELAVGYANLATAVGLDNGKTVAMVNVASNFASEVGNLLSELHWFSAMFVVSPKDKVVIVSLRSKAGTGADVSLIARHYGGGGHVNAAGFSINYIDNPGVLSALISGELFNTAIAAIDGAS